MSRFYSREWWWRLLWLVLALVVLGLPLLVGIWGLGIVIGLELGLSDHVASLVGWLLVIPWLVAVKLMVRWGDKLLP